MYAAPVSKKKPREFWLHTGRLSFTLLFVSVLLFSEAQNAFADEAGETGTGSRAGHIRLYEGEAWSGGVLVPVQTWLNFRGSRIAGGIYRFGKSRKYCGKLTHCALSAGQMLSCQWRDPFGTGIIAFQFSPDLHLFEGYWGTSRTDLSHSWNGGWDGKRLHSLDWKGCGAAI